MKTLKQEFRKTGLDYTLFKRNDKVALFILGLTSFPDGYEVCRIYTMKKHQAFGVDFEESEKISSNDQFLADGSGSFRSLENALKHFEKLSEKLVRDTNVELKCANQSEEIVDYQPIGDLVS
jgi:hypothetical protein